MKISPKYLFFLFDDFGNLKKRYAPVISYQAATNSFVLKYSIPGYHQPRQYFYFSSIPDKFPNQFVEDIFSIFSITDSVLYRHPKSLIPSPRLSVLSQFFDIFNDYSDDEVDAANYNLNLAIKLGRIHHSLFYFDSYLEAYKILHPEIRRYSKNVVRNIQAEFNKLISD